LQQSPDPGSKLRRNALVVLTVSSGPVQRALPDVVGLRADAAARKLRAAGLVPELRLVRSTRPAGTVVDQAPAAGTRVAHGSSVGLDVAKHVPAVVRVRVPGVVGLSPSAARSRLGDAGLHASTVRVTSAQPTGAVVQQSPVEGTEVRKGSTVRLSVSSGSAQVVVPEVVGLDQQSAEDQLQSLGFRVRVVNESTTDQSQDGTVTAEDPQGGAKAPDGSTVTITVAQLSSP
jgi:serine/threonine-protein kinase